MGKLQQTLDAMLGGIGVVQHKQLPLPTLHDIHRAGFGDLFNAVYKSIGGVLETPELRLGPWDLEFDGIAVELDEHLHFNRYRALTLRAPAYTTLPGFPLDAYRSYSTEFEAACVQAGGYGGKWTNPSCERQFGHASEYQTLEGSGAPRWKQRAFYDFAKDLGPLVLGIKVARLAVWGRLPSCSSTRTVKEVLSTPGTGDAKALVDLIRIRAA
ncbi:hypothetical protein Q3O97_05635 [Ralstonia pseudosolanacearum]|uniref:DUF7255 family protein n=1 Tax=Ralstonia pseudosolanacearum TaxID=1310165 RepID=UPI002704B080|nr:hypothetical protein [Ralstonia pseudosolanacearum]MDO3615319.1 hypothetical protein [Ralstonia pseudosolanacearum]